MNRFKLCIFLVLLSCRAVKAPEVRYLHIGYLCQQEESTVHGSVDISWKPSYFPSEDSLSRYIQCSQDIRGKVIITGIYSFRNKTEYEQFIGKKEENMEREPIDSLSINCDL